MNKTLIMKKNHNRSYIIRPIGSISDDTRKLNENIFQVNDLKLIMCIIKHEMTTAQLYANFKKVKLV
jgi:hypothetical protein